MIPLNVPGKVKAGPLKGWWMKIQPSESPQGYLVSRARNPEMDQTLVLDGIFPTLEVLKTFLEEQAPVIAWSSPEGS